MWTSKYLLYYLLTKGYKGSIDRKEENEVIVRGGYCLKTETVQVSWTFSEKKYFQDGFSECYCGTVADLLNWEIKHEDITFAFQRMFHKHQPLRLLVKIDLCLFLLINRKSIWSTEFLEILSSFLVLRWKSTWRWNFFIFNTSDRRKTYLREFYIKNWNKNFRCKVKIPL